MGIYSRFHAPRLTHPMRSVLATLLAVATLLGVVGQAAPWNETGHAQHDAHGDHAETTHRATLADHADGHAERSAVHGECDAWSTITAEHDPHDNARFEPASRTHHHRHAAICGICLHAAVDLPTRSHGLAAADPSMRSEGIRQETPAGPLVLSRRSRAPPRA